VPGSRPGADEEVLKMDNIKDAEFLEVRDGLLMDCIPVEILPVLAEVFAYGAEKHQGADNWRAHRDKHYWLGKIGRHSMACQSGVRYDVGPGGSGLLHSAHILCDAACLVAAQLAEEYADAAGSEG
jgi:hypothetical protein